MVLPAQIDLGQQRRGAAVVGAQGMGLLEIGRGHAHLVHLQGAHAVVDEHIEAAIVTANFNVSDRSVGGRRVGGRLPEKFLEESHSMSGRKKGMTGVPSLCGTGRTVSFPCI